MSKLLEAVAGLVAITETALPTAQVINGVPTVAMSKPNVVVLAWTPEDELAAESSIEWGALGNRRRNEEITIRCAADSASGGLDIPTRRSAAVAMVTAIAEGVRADPTLGGAVLHSLVSDFSVFQRVDEERGLSFWVPFTVRATAQLITA